jgi:signal transduction histidine kinase
MTTTDARSITGQAKAEEAGREQQALAAALREAGAALVGTLSFDEVLDLILAQAARVLPHDAATVMLIEEGIARIVRSRGYAERGLAESVLALRTLVAVVPSLSYMAQTGKPLAIPYAQSYPGWADLPATRWIKAHAGAPICVKGQVIGFLTLDSEKSNAFSQMDAERLQAFADQAGIAIENARLYRSLQETNAQLQSAMQIKEEVIQNVSHELRTPLTLILGYLELLMSGGFGPLPSTQEGVMKAMHRQGERLRFMVDRLLLLQTFQIDLLQSIRQDVDTWLQEAVAPWIGRTDHPGIEIRLEITPGLPPVAADPAFLDQVIYNLLDNAVKFSPEGGVVWVKAWAEGDEVIIAISDPGIGIPPDKQKWLFERFYQVDSSLARPYGGLGVGLALCRMIIEAHGGRIWVESEGEDRGSTFRMALPMLTPATAECD